jgi:hypothetical protein
MRLAAALIVAFASSFAVMAALAAAPIGGMITGSGKMSPTASTELDVRVTDVPPDGGFEQVSVTALAPTNVTIAEKESWNSSTASSSQGWGFALVQSGASDGGGFGGAAGPRAIDVRFGNGSWSCCDAALGRLPAATAAGSSGARGYGNLRIVMRPNSPLILTVYATSWRRGSYVDLDLSADAPVLSANFSAPVRGGVRTFDLASASYESGNHVSLLGFDIGPEGPSTATAEVARGYIVAATVVDPSGTATINWTLPNGTRGSFSHPNFTVLYAGGPTPGTLALSTPNHGGSNAISLASAPFIVEPKPGVVAPVIVADVNPMGAWLEAHP